MPCSFSHCILLQITTIPVLVFFIVFYQNDLRKDLYAAQAENLRITQQLYAQKSANEQMLSQIDKLKDQLQELEQKRASGES